MRYKVLENRSKRIYVPLRANASPRASSGESPLLLTTLVNFLESERRVFLLLGGAGSGKSAFCWQFMLKLWRDYKEGGRIPIYVDLREIERPRDDLIVTRLQEYGFSDAVSRELLNRRQIVLVCDGYDESRLSTSLYTKRLCQLNVKMVITCRNTYLGRNYQGRFYPLGDDKYHGKPSELFEEATIVPFSESDIQDYVNQHVLHTAPQEPFAAIPASRYDETWKKLSAIPNLMNLVTNPFLLSLALGALPSLAIDPLDPAKNKATRLELFDRFVDEWIRINICRLQQSNLSQKDRTAFNSLLDEGYSWYVKDFSKRLAVAMHENQKGDLVVKFSRRHNEPWKTEFFGAEIETTLLREVSPLSRYGSLHWFIHKSLFDYFRSLVLYDPDESYEDGLDGGGDDSHGGGGHSFSNGNQGLSGNMSGNSGLPGANGTSTSGGSTGDSSSGSSESNNSSSGSNNFSAGSNSSSEGTHGVPENGEGSRQGKESYRSRRKASTNNSRASTSSNLFSKENLLEDPDVLEFLVERAHSDPRFRERLLSTIKQSKASPVPSLAAANAIAILVRSGEQIDSVDLTGIRVPSDYVSEKYKELAKLSDNYVADATLQAILPLPYYNYRLRSPK
ncbi:hypothetical protein BGZ97_012055 [Linnemannia gamsii]|uniref:NACHT domain-containing protein n=1 Tax=Linnemannia gamsii TaxID=64522 RepID=A0A9P6R687_9FUNG|nr:hypothetical protein BGZ97_012055 [Linnemannia gamsii]